MPKTITHLTLGYEFNKEKDNVLPNKLTLSESEFACIKCIINNWSND